MNKCRKCIIALIVILIPLSYSTKFLIGLPDITWINPTLILSVLFCLCTLDIKIDSPSVFIVLMAFFSAIVGYIITPDWKLSLYPLFRESVRLLLCVIFMHVMIYALTKNREYVLKCLSITVCLEFFFSIYLIIGAYSDLGLSGDAREYMRIYLYRQAIWINGDIMIPRPGGTFIESPIYGLFMICSYIILTISRKEYIYDNRLIKTGQYIAMIGAIISLSSQVIAGLAVFWIYPILKQLFVRKQRNIKYIGYTIIGIVCSFYYLLDRTIIKIREINNIDISLIGFSLGERIFHIYYSLQIITDNLLLLLFGIGPGRYGTYLSKIFNVAEDTGIQVVPMDWLAETGMIGLSIIIFWLYNIYYNGKKKYCTLAEAGFFATLISVLFQANWRWECWFFVWALMLSKNNSKVVGGINGQKKNSFYSA